uniref:Protein-serine/threonine kinase n=1 Tax=Petromyzon marinus TaxID=7757 RepID=A0AAJ7UEA5_PETMA|nr:pyruvate dehydrogenase (acetyl-transferring) kinase isozyme 3, mitochondrial-like isoform X3 [Petromyzon marinus]
MENEEDSLSTELQFQEENVVTTVRGEEEVHDAVAMSPCLLMPSHGRLAIDAVTKLSSSVTMKPASQQEEEGTCKGFLLYSASCHTSTGPATALTSSPMLTTLALPRLHSYPAPPGGSVTVDHSDVMPEVSLDSAGSLTQQDKMVYMAVKDSEPEGEDVRSCADMTDEVYMEVIVGEEEEGVAVVSDSPQGDVALGCDFLPVPWTVEYTTSPKVADGNGDLGMPAQPSSAALVPALVPAVVARGAVHKKRDGLGVSGQQQQPSTSYKNACERTSFIFLRQELPVRLANTMKEINLLPDKLLHTPSVQLVQSWYAKSMTEILGYVDKNPDDGKVLTNFTETLLEVRTLHKDVVPTMAQGVMEYKEVLGVDLASDRNVQYFLDRFYMSRISFRMLINQHALLFGLEDIHPKHIGTIDPTCQVAEVVQGKNPGLPIQAVYVPSHLFHMLFELLKNAVRATVEHHGESDFPPVHVLITLGPEDLTIKVSDQGGGVPLRKIERLFHYMYSTAPPPHTDVSRAPPLAGFGFGLPISRLYAQYFNGDLKLYSMEGQGTDALIYLKALSSESVEKLPVFNRSAWRHYRNLHEADDWCVPSSEPRNVLNKTT